MSSSRRPGPAGLVGVTVVAVLSLAACGVSGDATDHSAAGDGGAGQGGPKGDSRGQQMPGAFGTIAAITGRTLQVQNPMTGQVAVTYTAKTSIEAEVKASLSDVTVGSCVLVTSAASGSPAPTGAPTGSMTASTVRILPGTGGSCGLGRRGSSGGSGRPGWSGSSGASGAPSDGPKGAPGGMPSGAGRVGFGAAGEVTAVSKTGFTMSTTRPPASGSGSPAPTSLSVRVTGTTAYTTTQRVTSKDLKVGKCLEARGTTDDTGAVTATEMTVSDPVGGQCAGAVMRGPR